MDILFFLFWFIYDESIDHLSYIYEKKYLFIYKKKAHLWICYFYIWCELETNNIFFSDAIALPFMFVMLFQLKFGWDFSDKINR